jgi:hypothetical protein
MISVSVLKRARRVMKPEFWASFKAGCDSVSAVAKQPGKWSGTDHRRPFASPTAKFALAD